MKVCNNCGLTKPLDEYHVNRAGREQRNSHCKACYNAAKRAAYAEDSSLTLWRSKVQHLRNAYNMTPEQYDALLKKQGGRCAVCRTDRPGGRGNFHVDHDHNCCPGKKSCGACVRGLLCLNCNAGLGQFRDDPALLAAALAYLAQSDLVPAALH